MIGMETAENRIFSIVKKSIEMREDRMKTLEEIHFIIEDEIQKVVDDIIYEESEMDD